MVVRLTTLYCIKLPSHVGLHLIATVSSHTKRMIDPGIQRNTLISGAITDMCASMSGCDVDRDMWLIVHNNNRALSPSYQADLVDTQHLTTQTGVVQA